jgi:hypothetical protein
MHDNPDYWPGRLAYANLLAHVHENDDALGQIATAVDGGGASFEKIVEAIKQDMDILGERQYEFMSLLYPGADWEKRLRQAIEEKVKTRQAKSLPKG